MKPRVKPRNPLVVPAMFRKAGSHGKLFKTQRRADKVALVKDTNSGRQRVTFLLEPQPKLLRRGTFDCGSGFQHCQCKLKEQSCKQKSFSSSSIRREVI